MTEDKPQIVISVEIQCSPTKCSLLCVKTKS